MNSHNGDNHNDSKLLKKSKLLKPQPFQFSFKALMNKLYNINPQQYDEEYKQFLAYQKQYMQWYKQQPEYIEEMADTNIDMSPMFYLRKWKKMFKEQTETGLQKFLTALILPVYTLVIMELTGKIDYLIDKYDIGCDMPFLFIPLVVLAILVILQATNITGHIAADLMGIPMYKIQKAFNFKVVNPESPIFKKSMEMSLEYLLHPTIYRKNERVFNANLKERNFLLVNDFMCKYPHLQFDLDAWQAAQGCATEFVCREGGIRIEKY